MQTQASMQSATQGKEGARQEAANNNNKQSHNLKCACIAETSVTGDGYFQSDPPRVWPVLCCGCACCWGANPWPTMFLHSHTAHK